MEPGAFSQNQFVFPTPSPLNVDQNIPLAIQLKKICIMSVHIHQLLYVQQKEQEKKIRERREKTILQQSDVAEPSLIFLIVNVSPVGAQFWTGKQQVLFFVCVWFLFLFFVCFCLVNSSCLLLEHINCIFILHFQLCRCVCFINWLPIEPESDLPH